MNATLGSTGPNPNGPGTLSTANPWFTAANSDDYQRYQNAVQETNPQYANLQNLLNKIYGSNIAASE